LGSVSYASETAYYANTTNTGDSGISLTK